MSSSRDMLSLYEAVTDISQQMLEAARRKDWKGYGQLELLCKGYIHQIPNHDDKTPLNAEALQRKVACLKTILSNDKEIMDLLQPWMLRLSDILHSSVTRSN
jgi:flagellar protein FliT